MKKGISLVALVITIIVLVILTVGVVMLATGENGIITRAQRAIEEHNKQSAMEEVMITISDYKIRANIEGITIAQYFQRENIDLIGKNITYTIEDDGIIFIVAGKYQVTTDLNGNIVGNVVLVEDIIEEEPIVFPTDYGIAVKEYKLVKDYTLEDTGMTATLYNQEEDGREYYNMVIRGEGKTPPSAILSDAEMNDNPEMVDIGSIDIIEDGEQNYLIGHNYIKECNIENVYVEEGVVIFNSAIFTGPEANNTINSIYLAESVKEIINDYNDYNGYNDQSVNLQKLYSNNIEKIGSIFAGSDIEEVVLPNSLKSIEDEVFCYCENLESIIIPEGVTNIGDAAFYCCNNLKNVTMPESLKSIGFEAFSYCENLENITIPEGIESIEFNAFACTKWLSNNKFLILNNTLLNCDLNATGTVIIPEGVTSIGDKAFSGCTGVTNIIIPSSITSIGDRAFAATIWLSEESLDNGIVIVNDILIECDNYVEGTLTIPEGVTSIGAGAFLECNYLENVIIPSSVTSIGDRAFYGCDNLTEITIPNSVTSIGDGVFKDTIYILNELSNNQFVIINDILIACNNDEEGTVIIPEGVTSIDSTAFYTCSNLKSIIIPEGVTSIKGMIFTDLISLESITIPEGITSIEDNAFYGYFNLENVSIPSSVTSIGKFGEFGSFEVDYQGTMSQWLSICEHTSFRTIHCIDGDI